MEIYVMSEYLDTIEPSKKFPNYRNEDVLNLISIEYSLRDNFLYVEIDGNCMIVRQGIGMYLI